MKWHLRKPSGRAERARFSGRVDDLAILPARPHLHLDYLSRANAWTHAPKCLFVISAAAKPGVTLLPFPTGRNFSKKIFIFLRFGSKLAQILLDNSLSYNV
jgi:hypothetical protein